MTLNGTLARKPDGRSLPISLERPDHLGALIVVEGVDGSGKSTQLELLRDWLIGEGADVVCSAWNSSPLVAPAVRRAKRRLWIGRLSLALLQAADLMHRYETVILPALQASRIVLADRYVFTAFARDVARNFDRAAIRRLYSFALRPDLALYFRLSVDAALQRILASPSRDGLKFYEAGLDLDPGRDAEAGYRHFQGRVVEEYDHMVDEYGLTAVDASRPIEAQHAEVRALAGPILDRHLALLNRRREGERRPQAVLG